MPPRRDAKERDIATKKRSKTPTRAFRSTRVLFSCFRLALVQLHNGHARTRAGPRVHVQRERRHARRRRKERRREIPCARDRRLFALHARTYAPVASVTREKCVRHSGREFAKICPGV
ncbi:hypothetical protein PUN28_006058 [Cardiocondyla obscurior]|uniref:Histone H3 n=1 Tax=Cardiocondyla obscurior TaxID=286306 RepID=A0AAW2GBU7_9HYME